VRVKKSEGEGQGLTAIRPHPFSFSEQRNTFNRAPTGWESRLGVRVRVRVRVRVGVGVGVRVRVRVVSQKNKNLEGGNTNLVKKKHEFER
jgi:hypothetical protein